MSEYVCPYCQRDKENKPLFENHEVYELDDMEEIVTIEKSCGEYAIEVEADSPIASAYMHIPINFCPICGRKLIDD